MLGALAMFTKIPSLALLSFAMSLNGLINGSGLADQREGAMGSSPLTGLM